MQTGAGTGHTTCPHIPQFLPHTTFHHQVIPFSSCLVCQLCPSIPPCSVRQRQSLASAGQDPAIIEHVQGSESILASAWHLPPGTYWLPFPSMSQEPELKTNLTITAQRNKQSPHSSDIPLTLADQQEPLHFPWWHQASDWWSYDAARLGSSELRPPPPLILYPCYAGPYYPTPSLTPG